MKCKVICILVLIGFSMKHLAAQNISDSTKVDTNLVTVIEDPVFYPKTQELITSFNYDFASHLNNAFLMTYLSSGFIDDELKNENLNRLNGENNPLGMSSDFILQYRNVPGNLFGNATLGYSFAVEWHSVNELLFSDDLFSLLFFGTQQFAGQEPASLHNTITNNLNYYQLKGGLFNKDDFNDLEFGFQVAINLGNQYSSFRAENASLYVDSLGQYLDFQGELYYVSTSVTGNNYSKIQGYGASVDLYFQKEIERNYKFRIDIRNLGYIYWNNETQIYNEAQTVHFEGIEIDNIFDNSISISSTSLQDSISNYIVENSKFDNKNIYTPADISIYYMRYLSKYISVNGNFRYRVHSLADTYYSIGADYHFNKDLSLGGNLNYGAYSKINIGLNFQVKIKTNFAIEFQSRYLTGMIAHSFSGIGAFMQLNYKF